VRVTWQGAARANAGGNMAGSSKGEMPAGAKMQVTIVYVCRLIGRPDLAKTTPPPSRIIIVLDMTGNANNGE